MTDTDSRETRRRQAATGAVQDAHAFAIDVARIAAENKTENITVLDLRGLSNITDYFVIGTGTSGRQMHAVLDHVKEHAREVGRQHFSIGDSNDASWLLADYVDVVIHLFDEEHRSYYDLDGLWGDAPVVEWAEAEDKRNDADPTDVDSDSN